MGFSWQEYWSGLPFPSPGGLPDPGIEQASPTSPALAHSFFIWASWEAHMSGTVLDLGMAIAMIRQTKLLLLLSLYSSGGMR